jgi:hypothetical protein
VQGIAAHAETLPLADRTRSAHVTFVHTGRSPRQQLIQVEISLPPILAIAAIPMSADAVIDLAAFVLQHLDAAAVAFDPIKHLGHDRISDTSHRLSPQTNHRQSHSRGWLGSRLPSRAHDAAAPDAHALCQAMASAILRLD